MIYDKIYSIACTLYTDSLCYDTINHIPRSIIQVNCHIHSDAGGLGSATRQCGCYLEVDCDHYCRHKLLSTWLEINTTMEQMYRTQAVELRHSWQHSPCQCLGLQHIWSSNWHWSLSSVAVTISSDELGPSRGKKYLCILKIWHLTSCSNLCAINLTQYTTSSTTRVGWGIIWAVCACASAAL